MGIYVYCTAWAFAETPEDLESLTNEQLVKLTKRLGKSEDEGKDWLVKQRIELAGQIQEKNSLNVRMYAGGSRGHCLYVRDLSLMHPKLLFVAVDGADCTDTENLLVVKNGNKIFGYESDKLTLPGGIELKELNKATYSEVEKMFDVIKGAGDGWFQDRDAFIQENE